jgi:CDP-diacylglycerol---serine O-phosphatidyltransferase
VIRNLTDPPSRPHPRPADPDAGTPSQDPRDPKLPRKVALVKLIPNLLTCAAFCCGLIAMAYANRYQPTLAPDDLLPLQRACALLGVAFLLDGFDGRLARMLKATSRFGERFDSISDFVCFGLAPAFILHRWILNDLDELGFAIAAAYALFAALRLARFTRQQRKKSLSAPVSKFFQGVPAPAAAFIVLFPLLISLSHTSGPLVKSLPDNTMLIFTALLTSTVALLMISRIPMLSVKHIKVDRRILWPLMFATVIVAALLMRDPWLTIATFAGLYLLSLPISAYRASQAAKQATPSIP